MRDMRIWKLIDCGPRWAAAGCYLLCGASVIGLVPNREWGILLATFLPAGLLLLGVCVRLSAWVLKAGMWEEAGAAFMRFGLYTVLIPIFVVVLAPTESGGRSAFGQCQNNLKQWGLVFKMFANESSGGYFPELNPESGRLMWANTSAEGNAPVYPEYLTDLSILLCPNAKVFE
ncbi:MAG: hypothetical protein IT368_13200, partial [Candidatus Hydrogenedentes bacterium]|nr:hypothetical protein [Candidatus Hydrogenedentota bacterium]